MLTDHQKNIATCIHLSTFSRFLIPLGNMIVPTVLWIMNKDKSNFINSHGKQAINFQISILFYTIIIGALTIPFFILKSFSGLDVIDFNSFNDIHINIGHPSPLLYLSGGLGLLAIIGFILELIFIVVASLKARDGEIYKYPLTINFLK